MFRGYRGRRRRIKDYVGRVPLTHHMMFATGRTSRPALRGTPLIKVSKSCPWPSGASVTNSAACLRISAASNVAQRLSEAVDSMLLIYGVVPKKFFKQNLAYWGAK